MKMSENTNIYCNVNALTYSPGAGEFQGFTPEQIKLFRDAFAIFDTSRTGCITSQDLTAVMRNLGQNPSEKEIADMVNEIDADGNATIEFDEFLGMMEEKMRSVIPDETLKEAFQVFDRDGMLNYKEFAAMMN